MRFWLAFGSSLITLALSPIVIFVFVLGGGGLPGSSVIVAIGVFAAMAASFAAFLLGRPWGRRFLAGGHLLVAMALLAASIIALSRGRPELLIVLAVPLLAAVVGAFVLVSPALRTEGGTENPWSSTS